MMSGYIIETHIIGANPAFAPYTQRVSLRDRQPLKSIYFFTCNLLNVISLEVHYVFCHL